jgi:hypothetical protein
MKEFERVQVESRAELRAWLEAKANHPEALAFKRQQRQE